VRPPTGTNLAIREATASFQVAIALRRRARRGIQAIDAVLDALEEYHLSRLPRNVPLLPTWRARLEKQGGLSLPEHILWLRNTVRLHEALMDWQDELLNQAVPGRAQLTREDEEREAQQRLRYLGRPHRRRSTAGGHHDLVLPGAA
jgi:hypothetical protein